MCGNCTTRGCSIWRRLKRRTEAGLAGTPDRVWSEWEMRGTRRDGAAHLMRGVIIFGVRDERAAWARFFLEPVDLGDTDAGAAVRQVLGASQLAVADESAP